MFRLESEMALPVARWMEKQRLLTKREFETPFGVCDLVGVSLRAKGIHDRLAHGQVRPIGSITRALMLQSIPDVETGHSRRESTVFRAFADTLPDDLIAKEIDRLIRDKFVVRRTPKCLQKVNGWAPLHRRIVAVELKLDRVEAALAQAQAHLTYADESYIALPSEVAARVHEFPARWNRYWKLGIGLLSTAETTCRVLRRSRASSTHRDEALQMYVVDKFWPERSKAIEH